MPSVTPSIRARAHTASTPAQTTCPAWRLRAAAVPIQLRLYRQVIKIRDTMIALRSYIPEATTEQAHQHITNHAAPNTSQTHTSPPAGTPQPYTPSTPASPQNPVTKPHQRQHTQPHRQDRLPTQDHHHPPATSQQWSTTTKTRSPTQTTRRVKAMPSVVLTLVIGLVQPFAGLRHPRVQGEAFSGTPNEIIFKMVGSRGR
ncbi:DUF6545 domain-containing protein [Streptomyces sp. NPDC001339]|uniref:DUF6545 domain-containing protein n=1 Tax=Streptomyces sp. NPDC001339 TaxID=3364563 RepID=UPI003686C33E